MIAVDTSALIAIALNEAEADACIAALTTDDDVKISAGTLAEVLVVAARRNLSEDIAHVLATFGFEVIDVTPAGARRIADAYGRWRRGIHPAGLNFGDCFAYEVAKEHGCALLYVGNDFAQTDIPSAI